MEKKRKYIKPDAALVDLRLEGLMDDVGGIPVISGEHQGPFDAKPIPTITDNDDWDDEEDENSDEYTYNLPHNYNPWED